MAEEAVIQVALDGAGKEVKQFLLRGVVQGDGTTADVYVQCVAVVGSDGRAVSLDGLERVLNRIRKELTQIRKMVGDVTDHGGELELAEDDENFEEDV